MMLFKTIHTNLLSLTLLIVISITKVTAQCTIENNASPSWSECILNGPQTKLSTATCNKIKAKRTGMLGTQTLELVGNASDFAPLKRGENYALCGSFPGRMRSNRADIDVYFKYKHSASEAPTYVHKYQLKSRPRDDFRFFELPVNIPSIAEDGKGLEEVVLVFSDCSKRIGKNRGKKKIRSHFKLAVESLGTISNTALDAPTTFITSVCTKGIVAFEVANPQKADKLYLFSPYNSFTTQTYSTTILGYYSIPFSPNPTTGNFDVQLDIQSFSQYYSMAYGAVTLDTSQILLSPQNPFVVINLDVYTQDATMFDTNFLEQCKDVDICGLPDVNSYILKVNPAVPSYMESKLLTNLGALSYLENLELTLKFRWEDSINTTTIMHNGLPAQSVCYENLNKKSSDPANYKYCRKYTLFSDIEVSFNLKYPNQTTSPILTTTGCEERVYSVVLCQEVTRPDAMSYVFQSGDVIAKVPCLPDMRGVEFWSDKTNGVLIKGPPVAPTSPPDVVEDYFNCPSLLSSQFDLARFSINSASVLVGIPYKVLWMNYVTRDGRRSKRAPLTFFKVDLSTFNNQYTTLKHPEPNSECGTESSLLLENDVSALYSDLNQDITRINELLLGDASLAANTNQVWTSTQNIRFNTLENKQQVCYPDLPTEGGSCAEFFLESTIYFTSILQNACDPSVQYTFFDTTKHVLGKRIICKELYPPVPETFLVCDGKTPTTICLNEIEPYTTYEWERQDDNFFILDTSINSACETKKWQTYIGSFGPTNRRYIRFNVSSKSSYNGYVRRSDPTPVVIIIAPEPISETPLSLGIKKPATANENDLPNYCTNPTAEPLTYFDLVYNSMDHENDFQATLDEVETAVPGLTFTKNIDVVWQDSLYYEKVNGVERVCYGNLQPGDPSVADSKERKYTGTLNTKTDYCFDFTVFDQYSDLDQNVFSQPYLYGLAPDSSLCQITATCEDKAIDQVLYKMKMPLSPLVQKDPPIELIDAVLINVDLYPNPADNKVNIFVKGTKELSLVYTIQDAMGRTLQEGVVEANKASAIDLLELAPGTYYLQLRNTENQSVANKRFAKE